jgi:hypothetical protein
MSQAIGNVANNITFPCIVIAHGSGPPSATLVAESPWDLLGNALLWLDSAELVSNERDVAAERHLVLQPT